jgi:hypothetical protein
MGVKSVTVTTAKPLDVKMESMDALAAQGSIPVTLQAIDGARFESVSIMGGMPQSCSTRWSFVATATGFSLTAGADTVPVTMSTPMVHDVYLASDRDCVDIDLRRWAISFGPKPIPVLPFWVNGGQSGTVWGDPKINNEIYAGGTIHGGPLADYISAGARADVIYGDAGNDTIIAGGGNDTVYGGDGNDVIFGDGKGASRVAGNDHIYAGNGDDSVMSGYGADTLYLGAGNDGSSSLGSAVVYGGPGNDGIVVNKKFARHSFVDCGPGRDSVLPAIVRHHHCEIIG